METAPEAVTVSAQAAVASGAATPAEATEGAEYPYLRFVADFDCEPNPENENELSFKVGDVIRVTWWSQDEWWFGILNDREGWLSPLYGHLEGDTQGNDGALVDRTQAQPENPYLLWSSEDKLQARSLFSNEMVNEERGFSSKIQAFVDNFIRKMELRDTDLKRELMSDPHIAVELSIFVEICEVVATLVSKYDQWAVQGYPAQQLAQIFLSFAPSLRLFGQYTSENSNALNAFRKFHRRLKSFWKKDPLLGNQPLEIYLMLPVQHYPQYLAKLQKYVHLTPSSTPEERLLMQALGVVTEHTEEVDEILRFQESHLVMLTIQSQFIGTAEIYKAHRKFVRQGTMEKFDDNHNPVLLFFHLFNDALVYSRRIGSLFKFSRAINLRVATLNDVADTTESKYGFKVATPDRVWEFRCHSASEKQEWMEDLQTQIFNSKFEPQMTQTARRSTVRRRTQALIRESLDIVQPTSLGSRGRKLFSMLQEEIRFVENINKIRGLVATPLLEASKGMALKYSREDLVEDTNALFTQTGTTFNVMGSTIQKMRNAAITNALRTSEMQIFIRVADTIAEYILEVQDSLETRGRLSAWSEDFCVGDIFVNATHLYTQLESYAASYAAALRVMKSSNLREFTRDVEISFAPATLDSQIEMPILTTPRYLKYTQSLLEVTPTDHADHSCLFEAVQKLRTVSGTIAEVVNAKKNYEKLLDIKNNFVNVKMFQETVIDTLVTNDRLFIREGDLEKACRRRNKIFRFWLFNDLLLYGSLLPTGLYQLNRSLPVQTSNVCPSSSSPKSFEVHSSEKSFVVICSSNQEMLNWVRDFEMCAKAYDSTDALKKTQSSAPLWVQNFSVSSCSGCHQAFSISRLRHHCRKCGSVVCSQCSKSRVVLPHIDGRKKQRTCDTCMRGGNAKELDADAIRVIAGTLPVETLQMKRLLSSPAKSDSCSPTTCSPDGSPARVQQPTSPETEPNYKQSSYVPRSNVVAAMSRRNSHNESLATTSSSIEAPKLVSVQFQRNSLQEAMVEVAEPNMGNNNTSTPADLSSTRPKVLPPKPPKPDRKSLPGKIAPVTIEAARIAIPKPKVAPPPIPPSITQYADHAVAKTSENEDVFTFSAPAVPATPELSLTPISSDLSQTTESSTAAAAAARLPYGTPNPPLATHTPPLPSRHPPPPPRYLPQGVVAPPRIPPPAHPPTPKHKSIADPSPPDANPTAEAPNPNPNPQPRAPANPSGQGMNALLDAIRSGPQQHLKQTSREQTPIKLAHKASRSDNLSLLDALANAMANRRDVIQDADTDSSDEAFGSDSDYDD